MTRAGGAGVTGNDKGRSRARAVLASAVAGGVALTTALGLGATAVAPQVLPRDIAVRPSALITHGSATNWGADGIDRFYGVDWNATYGDTVKSFFVLFPYNGNPDNLTAALRNNVGDDKPDLVLTSGRGSGAATVTMLLLLNSGNQADRDMVINTRWILDNNVNRPNGGYGSRYIPFTILGVYPWPTPIDVEGMDILDVGYEYAWNSSAPAYVTNVVALLNALVAYAYRYKSQAYTHLPIDPDKLVLDPETGQYVPGPDAFDEDGAPKLEKGFHYIVEVDGTVRKVPLASGTTTTTYVTYRAAGVPLVQPLRDLLGPVGNAVADLVEPALKVIINASYPDNDPVANPDRFLTAGLLPPPDVVIRALNDLPGAIAEGVQNFTRHFAPAAPAPVSQPAGDAALRAAAVDEPGPAPAATPRRPSRPDADERALRTVATKVAEETGGVEDLPGADEPGAAPEDTDSGPVKPRLRPSPRIPSMTGPDRPGPSGRVADRLARKAAHSTHGAGE
ncbi:PE-PPE domain-containing protein [uncultured Mycolicibacterium sp.]|uniref:PE-PPE domain-containing protein n=1 Tax=uncultured Mycolicibacterium sp. TaxID=2320817 RepID=UPI00263A22B7|nr:PE-PPE domain-containing protein [uncultured Mycolicibacterium sp.]